ncbi:NAD(P)H-binding protein [Gordonia sp. zg691]|uniref:NAD(P)H-binding protein n=1 Tax=Gordonia jinghuaiqii TaxID=2758710 RepID=A0A7D7R143_9ACTN|nr:NAD(P)H-binding protein [Gordonia jinghuaiqii]MBD0860813.1 NAD(P)H-binding protein [Gordonia jinghuaiqii]MCR5979626.1 NAD(P)H-binding protein [Gordonia jinghuaiqii]QMT00587.1 NAD(P)H-binding protein [Gordonia jinghuaiqii]
MTRVAIIGGHGKIALRLARILADRGDQVTSIIRNPEHAHDVAETGATPVVADVETLDTTGIATAISEHDAVVWAAGAGGGDQARTYAVDRDAAIRSMDAALRAGVDRYVMVSYFGAGPDHGVPEDNSFHAYAEAKAAADTYLKSTELDWTILGPSRLTDEPGTGAIAVGGDRTDGDEVSRDNVAAVAAVVLARPSTVHQVIEFNDGDTPIPDALAAS